METLLSEVKPPARKGRPPKAAIEAKKNRGVVGRPAGDAARINEFKARLLGTSGEKVINTILRKALDDGDKDQAAMLKMCIDRILPMSAFEAAKDKNMTPQISINITGLNQPAIEMAQDVTDID